MGLFLIPEKNLNQSPVISGLPLRSRKLVLCWISLNRNSSYLFAWVLICFVIRGISVASLELLHSQLDNASRIFFFLLEILLLHLAKIYWSALLKAIHQDMSLGVTNHTTLQTTTNDHSVEEIRDYLILKKDLGSNGWVLEGENKADML